MGSAHDPHIDSAGPASPFSFLSRRRFLQWGFAGAALVAGAGGGLLALRGRAPAVSGLRVLSAHEYRTLCGIARAHLPRAGAFTQGADDFDLARRFDEFLADEPVENIKDLKLALGLFEYGPLWCERRVKTFSNLTEDEQTRHWERWVYHGSTLQRQIAAAFRKFLALAFYDNESVWAEIGYGGPAFKDVAS